jgi:hypothetical protein
MRTISDNPDDRPEARPARRLADLRVIVSAGTALLLLGVGAGAVLHGLARKEDVAVAAVAAVQEHEKRTDPEGVERRLRGLEIGQAEIKAVVDQNREISAWNQAVLFNIAQRQGVQVTAPPKHAMIRPVSTSSATAAIVRGR